MPNRRELFSLIDDSKFNPALSTGHPFTGVKSDYYWSSTTHADSTGNAWYVYLDHGDVVYVSKISNIYVWPVRSGQ